MNAVMALGIVSVILFLGLLGGALFGRDKTDRGLWGCLAFLLVLCWLVIWLFWPLVMFIGWCIWNRSCY